VWRYINARGIDSCGGKKHGNLTNSPRVIFRIMTPGAAGVLVGDLRGSNGAGSGEILKLDRTEAVVGRTPPGTG
jgi:hypothetical protein